MAELNDMKEYEDQPQSIILQKYYIRELNEKEGCPELIKKNIYEFTKKSGKEVECRKCKNECLELDKTKCLCCKKTYHLECRQGWKLTCDEKNGICLGCAKYYDMCYYCGKHEMYGMELCGDECNNYVCKNCEKKCLTCDKILCKSHNNHCNNCLKYAKKCSTCNHRKIIGINSCNLCKKDYCFKCKPRYKTCILKKSRHYRFTSLYDSAYILQKRNKNYK